MYSLLSGYTLFATVPLALLVVGFVILAAAELPHIWRIAKAFRETK